MRFTATHTDPVIEIGHAEQSGSALRIMTKLGKAAPEDGGALLTLEAEGEEELPFLSAMESLAPILKTFIHHGEEVAGSLTTAATSIISPWGLRTSRMGDSGVYVLAIGVDGAKAHRIGRETSVLHASEALKDYSAVIKTAPINLIGDKSHKGSTSIYDNFDPYNTVYLSTDDLQKRYAPNGEKLYVVTCTDGFFCGLKLSDITKLIKPYYNNIGSLSAIDNARDIKQRLVDEGHAGRIITAKQEREEGILSAAVAKVVASGITPDRPDFAQALLEKLMEIFFDQADDKTVMITPIDPASQKIVIHHVFDGVSSAKTSRQLVLNLIKDALLGWQKAIGMDAVTTPIKLEEHKKADVEIQLGGSQPNSPAAHGR